MSSATDLPIRDRDDKSIVNNNSTVILFPNSTIQAHQGDPELQKKELEETIKDFEQALQDPKITLKAQETINQILKKNPKSVIDIFDDIQKIEDPDIQMEIARTNKSLEKWSDALRMNEKATKKTRTHELNSPLDYEYTIAV